MTWPGRPDANNIRKARYFLERVREEEERDPWDLVALGSNLEAAIIFAKSLQDVLADEAGCRDERPKKQWMKRVGLWGNPVCKFLSDARDLVVHRDGTISVVEGRAVVVHVLPGRAYLRRTTGIISVSPANPTPAQKVRLRRQHCADLKAAARVDRLERIKLARRMREDRERDEAQLRAPRELQDPPPWARFDHENPKIGQRRATEVVQEYIAKLENILEQPVSYDPQTNLDHL